MNYMLHTYAAAVADAAAHKDSSHNVLYYSNLIIDTNDIKKSKFVCICI